MCITALAKQPAIFLREQTKPVRDHVSAMARLTDAYFASLKRAEADYFDGVKRITEALAHTAEAEAPALPEEPPQATE